MAQRMEIIVETIDKATGNLKKIEKTVRELSGSTERVTKSVATAKSGFSNFDTTIKKTTRGLRQFQFEWLGILFAGMAIQRLFEGIKNSAVDTFRKITESGQGAGTAITALSAHWEYLKFTVGAAINSALEPLLPTIMNIISSVTDWINQHPQLVAGLIMVGLAVGTLMATLGQFMLAILSLKMLLAGGAGGLLSILPKVAMAFSSFLIANPIVAVILLLVAGIVLLMAKFGLLGDIIKYFQRTWSVLWDIMSMAVEIFMKIIEVPWEFIRGFFEGLGIELPPLKKMWSIFWDSLAGAVEWAWSIIKPIFEAISSALDIIKSGANVLGKIVGGGIGAVGGAIGGLIPTAQAGGTLTRSGLVYAHQGETIVPNNSFGNINVTVNAGNVSSDIDKYSLAREIGDTIVSRISNYTSVATRYR